MMVLQELVAPCGMNCALCQAYQGKGLPCFGCGKSSKRKSCQNCSILKCDKKTRFCYECADYPCKRLKQLDQRYQSKYKMSMLENLDYIKTKGIDEFIKQQNKKYTCTKCGKLRTVHQEDCFYCTNMKKNI